MTASYRTLWISDVHLGTHACRASDLLEFLGKVRADRLYLLGDIVDLQSLKSRPLFPAQHLAVIAAFVELARHGTDVVYIPGNHDCEFRNMVGRDICGIPVMLEACHTTPAGKRLLVTHGDVLDGAIRKGTNLEKFGAAAYAVLLQADVLFNRLRRLIGQDHIPISASIKRRLRSANEYIARYETVAADYALQRGFDGIVCGHIHRPRLARIGDCLYANDGDWVEHRSALAETADGTLQILNWQADTLRVHVPEKAPSLAA